METFWEIWGAAVELLSKPLFKIGGLQLSVRTILYLVILGILLIYFARRLTTLLSDRVLARRNIDVGVRHATVVILRYFLITAGFIVILQTAGIDLTALNVVAGAVGIGVGFGLQNVANNFISGLIILFERPIKVGDRIEVGDVEGDVTQIKGRSTTVVTNDNIAIIVPNSNFITQNVINWSHVGKNVRFKIPVTVSFNSDVRLVEKLLLEVAAEDPDVLKYPEPGVRLLIFGENGLHFELRAWSESLLHRKGRLTSNLNFAIIEKFRRHNIEMPFPQRDIHIRSAKAVDAASLLPRE